MNDSSEQLRAQNRDLVLHHLSHELRTPLAVIMSSTELLQTCGRKWDDAKKDIHYGRIVDAVEKLSALMNEALHEQDSFCAKVSPSMEEAPLLPHDVDLMGDPGADARHILVIEDEAGILKNIREMLSGDGYRISLASSGEEGVKAAHELKPDLILCDVMMPGCDGYKVLEELRRDTATAAIPLLFLTARTDRSSVRRGMEMGAEDYITKPFTHQELLSAVQARLNRSDFLSERFKLQVRELYATIADTMPPQLLTPLNGVLGLSSILVEEYESLQSREVHDLARSIGESGWEIHRMVRKFLTYSELRLIELDRARILELRRENVCEVAVCGSRVVRDLGSHGISVEGMEFQWADARLAVSSYHFQRLLEELIEFAAAASAGPETRLSTLVMDSGLQLTVECAASSGEQNTEFNLTKGLGMTIVRSICNIYGGALDSECCHDGLRRIQVSLPLA